MSVNQRTFPTSSPEKLIQRQPGDLPLDVPQRHTYGTKRGHDHRAPSIAGASVEILPDVLAVTWILTNQTGNQVIRKTGNWQRFPIIERGIDGTVTSFISHYPEGNVIFPWPTHENFSA